MAVAEPRFHPLMVSVALLVSACSHLAGGLAGDRFTKHRAMVLFAVVQALGILAVALAQVKAFVALGVVLMSIGSGGLLPLSLAIMPDYFGTGSLGRILGVQGFILVVATEFAPFSYPFGPGLDDAGTYVLSYLFPLVLTLLAAFLFLKSTAPRGSGPGVGCPDHGGTLR